MKSWLAYASKSIQTIGTLPFGPIDSARDLLIAATRRQKMILVCGNGGSAADSMHFSAELMGRFKEDRAPIKCLSLAADSALLTAWANDMGFEHVFERQVEAFGEPGGVLIIMSTSGASPNVLLACKAAIRLGMWIISMTGSAGLKECLPHISICVPSSEAALIQQSHEVIYHYLAGCVEAANDHN